MDIEFDYIKEFVDDIKVYDTGYAFVADENFVIAYSKEFEAGTTIRGFSDVLADVDIEALTEQDMLYECEINGAERCVAFSRLNNGKIIAVIAPKTEIYEDSNVHVIQSVVVAGIITVVFIVLTLRNAKGMVLPLKKLDEAAKEIAEGNLEVDIDVYTKDEIGTLAESLRETVKQLKSRINYINNLAYMDKLTGVKNNTAYLNETSLLSFDIKNGHTGFSVFVIDVNGLKYINDTYGHDAGNTLIIETTRLIAEVFGIENVYRIGGDEFAVVLSDVTEEGCKAYKEQFFKMLNNQNGDVFVAAAIGASAYDKKRDVSYENVFKRADEEMYANKQKMKRDGLVSKWLKQS